MTLSLTVPEEHMFHNSDGTVIFKFDPTTLSTTDIIRLSDEILVNNKSARVKMIGSYRVRNQEDIQAAKNNPNHWRQVTVTIEYN